MVRARRPGDIARVFPGAKERRTPGNDYLFRALIKREDVAKAIHDHIMGIKYPNFKNSVADDDLHNAYSSVWSVIGRLQAGGPYGSKNQGKSKNHSWIDEADDDSEVY